MGSTGSKEGAEKQERNCSRNNQPTTPARSPYQPSPQSKERRESTLIYGGMLLDLFDNASNWQNMPYPRRVALIESIRRTKDETSDTPHELYQNLTEIVMEGLLTCDGLTAEEKNFIVIDGLLEQRWDRIFARYPPLRCQIYSMESRNNNNLDEFYSYRHMILVILKNSYKMQQQLPEESRQRVKQMILRTDSKEKLDDLLLRILERMCGIDFQEKIMRDMEACRYYRLAWPDRLDCERRQLDSAPVATTGVLLGAADSNEDIKLPANAAKSLAYGSILLPDDLTHRQDCCPICLDPVQAPALELSCNHVFCSRCISNWILQQHQSTCHSHDIEAAHKQKIGEWHCPVCRQVHDKRA